MYTKRDDSAARALVAIEDYRCDDTGNRSRVGLPAATYNDDQLVNNGEGAS